jgi:hypothetical protein
MKVVRLTKIDSIIRITYNHWLFGVEVRDVYKDFSSSFLVWNWRFCDTDDMCDLYKLLNFFDNSEMTDYIVNGKKEVVK